MNIIDILNNSDSGLKLIWSGKENDSELKMILDNCLVCHCKYKNGKKHGFNKEFNPISGELLVDSCYYYDKLEGDYKRWNWEGKLVEHYLYSNGKIIEDYLEEK